MSVARVAAAAALAIGLPGCFLWTTRGEGDDYAERIASLERGTEAERARLRAEVEDAERKVADLERVLGEATSVLRRNSADVGLEVQALREQIGTLDGRIAELEQTIAATQRILGEQRAEIDQRITTMARRAGVDLPVDASQIPADRTEHFAAAYRAYQASEYSECRALFREYIRRYPSDDQSDNAQYWIGASYMRENKPATALGEFQKVIATYPQADAADETLFDMASAFFELHACGDARRTLEALIATQATSRLVGAAREKLREVTRAPRAQCTR